MCNLQLGHCSPRLNVPCDRLSSRLPRKVCVPCAVPRVLSTDSVSQETQKQSLPSPFPNPRPLLCHSEYVHSELAGLTDRPTTAKQPDKYLLDSQNAEPSQTGTWVIRASLDRRRERVLLYV